MKARNTVLTCPDCGFSTKRTTPALAEHGLRLHSCDLTRERQARAARVQARAQRSGPVRDCEHPRARHQHGTRPAYVFDKCRCRPCTDAAAAYERNRVKQTVYGRWQPYVDAEPARAHVLQLMDAGMGWKRIARTAGVTLSIVSRLVYGKAALAAEAPSGRYGIWGGLSPRQRAYLPRQPTSSQLVDAIRAALHHDAEEATA